MKKLLISIFALATAFTAVADEGMWLPSLIAPRIKDMRAKGFRLTAEDIYSINKASMKDAVVLFGGGCTGELISAEGLLLTNHHCGYEAIQRHSSVEHDYLTYGFWARSREEELPNKKLNVRFLVRMDDVTSRIQAGEKAADIIAEAQQEGRYKASVEQMYYGNQQFLFVYEQFDDVRLVGAPPSSIGKFGGDTDNWVWPRHTGDFSLFRIYADANNRPAKYSKDNVPYRPRKHFAISTKGVKEGDFTMIYGFPGNTQEYIISDAVDYILHRSDPTKIALRTMRLDVIAAAQATDPAVRIKYAATHANIANSWKKWQGEVLGLKNLGTVEKKRAYEEQFRMWAADKPEYSSVVADLKAEYARITDAYFAYELMRETLGTLPTRYTDAERRDPLFKTAVGVDSVLFGKLFKAYYEECPRKYIVPKFARGVDSLGSVDAYAQAIAAVVSSGSGSAADELKADYDATMKSIQRHLGTRGLRNLTSLRLGGLYKTYVRGLREWDAKRAFFSDANLTLRVAYGKVDGYLYADGCTHTPQTTLDGIIAKDNPEIYDYDIPQSLRDIYATKDYGRWGHIINGKYTVPVCFLATNHTTGGNSGSPIINARGELIGINFDRTWLSTMSDIEFDESVCRNIAVDIRYVLFVVDRVGQAGYLFDEMDIK